MTIIIDHDHSAELDAWHQRADAAYDEIAACHVYLDEHAPAMPDAPLLDRIKHVVAQRNTWAIEAQLALLTDQEP